MKIPLHIAEKLLLLSNGEIIPDSSARHLIIDDLVSEGIIDRKGRIKKTLRPHNIDSMHTYLQNHYEISDLALYIQVIKKEDFTRSDLISVSSDSKIKPIRTFKGFLVNCYSPVPATLNNESITILPKEGTFNFIYDFEKFIPYPDITVVGIENPENFRYINKQKYLFGNIKPLFVSRYPQNQSKDLIKWLQLIPSKYLHFGDFDFAGLNIYINEYKKHLKAKAQFYIPPDIEELLSSKGNRDNYNNQSIQFNKKEIEEENILTLIQLIEKYKKGLEQEILIKH